MLCFFLGEGDTNLFAVFFLLAKSLRGKKLLYGVHFFVDFENFGQKMKFSPTST